MAIPIECERRFLVTSDAWRGKARAAHRIRQGYITSTDGVTVRVRRIGDRGFLTIKTPHQGFSRAELEYEIPCDHAEFLIASACNRHMVEKVRHDISIDGMAWTVDEFGGLNQGLVLAEIELDHADRKLLLPSWVGPEVTSSNQFHNSYLSRHPFSQWKGAAPHTAHAARLDG